MSQDHLTIGMSVLVGTEPGTVRLLGCVPGHWDEVFIEFVDGPEWVHQDDVRIIQERSHPLDPATL